MFKAKENKERERIIGAYGRLFGTIDGQIVLKDMETFCGQNRSSVCEELPNEFQTMFAEGKRRVFLRIIGFMELEQKKRNEQLRKESKNG